VICGVVVFQKRWKKPYSPKFTFEFKNFQVECSVRLLQLKDYLTAKEEIAK